MHLCNKACGVGAAVLLTVVSAAPVRADHPTRGCPSSFMAMTYYEFRDYSISLGNPPSAFPPTPGSGWRRIDQNGDGVNCIQDLPDNNGTLDGLAFNAVDNVSNH
jgi:hypothetical protein